MERRRVKRWGWFAGSAALAVGGWCVVPDAMAQTVDQEAARRAMAQCASTARVSVIVSPRQPVRGKLLRVLAVSEQPIDGGVIMMAGPNGLSQVPATHRGGPPYWWRAKIARPKAGVYRFGLFDGEGKLRGCTRRRVGRRVKPVALDPQHWWPLRRGWNRKMENLYSAWVENLFDAPADQRPTWRPLHAALRDARRNVLYNYLGANEDGPDSKRAIVAKPDCADLPYFLRAYFAWKLRLPMGYRQCSRGSSKRAPRCTGLKTNLDGPVPVDAGRTPAERFTYFLRRRLSYVHSGAGRTAPNDDNSDMYPLALTRSALRPGAAYVDPAGHILVVGRWVAQRGGRSGQLFAIESQPDLTVGRKRFWRGAFIFEPDTRAGAAGLKGFRPLTFRKGVIVPLTNAQIRRHKDYGDYSTEQYKLGLNGFYERMDRLINPQPLSPKQAYTEQLTALFELIQKRVDSVNTGEAYMKKHAGKMVSMPDGPRIFQTTGAWEDYATPARDFRLLLALDQVLGFPNKVIATPERFALKPSEKPAEVAAALGALRQRIANATRFQYTRSDGSVASVSMADVIARIKAFEMAYNPNDCIEMRWGATGDELSTCRRHAPAEQRRRMATYRAWFAKRYRPPVR